MFHCIHNDEYVNKLIAKVIFMIPQTLTARRFEIASLTFAIILLGKRLGIKFSHTSIYNLINRAIAKVICMRPQTLIARRLELSPSTFAITLV